MSVSDGLAGRLVDARKYVGLSQEFVAQQVGIQRSAVSDIERGVRKVSTDELALFARLYGRTVQALAIGEESGGDDAEIQALARVVGNLTEEDKREVVRFAEFLNARGKHQKESR